MRSAHALVTALMSANARAPYTLFDPDSFNTRGSSCDLTAALFGLFAATGKVLGLLLLLAAP
jgi:hypothetical protein